MRRPLPVLAAVSVALALPATAWGHASLVRTVPAAGAVLTRPPADVRVVFDDAIRVGPANAAIRNGGGSILAAKPHIAGGRTLVLPLRRALVDGDYSVRWSIVSDDGHLESGVLAFAVGVGRAPPSSTLAPAATGPTAESVVDRWLLLAGILTCVGLSLYVLVVRPAADPRVGERLPLLLSGAAVVTALGAGDAIHGVGLDTRAGAALGAGFATAIVVATFAGAATLDRRALRPALVLALGLAAVPSSAGHALDPGLTRLNVVADVLHVTGAAAWVGALLGVLVLPCGSARRTGLLAASGVLLLGVTGIVRASFELLHLSQLWDTGYGRTLLVKTAILVVALAAGWSLRARARRRAGVELVLVAGLVVAVSVLVLLRPGRNAVAVAGPAATVSAVGSEPSPPPPAPPPGAVVLAKELGPLGVALAVDRGTATATVLSPTGGGLSGLNVRIGGQPTAPCGHGCYRAELLTGTVPVKGLLGKTVSIAVEMGGSGQPLRTSFVVPRAPRPAAALVRRAAARYRALRSVVFRERLASDPTHSITALWRLESPDRLAYTIDGGSSAIILAGRRWDRESPAKPWQESQQTPLPQPAPQWTRGTNAHVIAQTAATTTVSFVDPTTPAYFTLTLDRRTLLPRLLHMTASAHFMTDRYVSFNAPRAIRPPR